MSSLLLSSSSSSSEEDDEDEDEDEDEEEEEDDDDGDAVGVFVGATSFFLTTGRRRSGNGFLPVICFLATVFPNVGIMSGGCSVLIINIFRPSV